MKTLIKICAGVLCFVVIIIVLITFHGPILAVFVCEEPDCPSTILSPSTPDNLLWGQEGHNYIDGKSQLGSEMIPVNVDGQEIGSLHISPQQLKFEQVDGKNFIVWNYERDYSGIWKITQTQDGRYLRVFVWTRLFIREEFVTQFDLVTKESKEFLISCRG